jgi:hypothetical protein
MLPAAGYSDTVGNRVMSGRNHQYNIVVYIYTQGCHAVRVGRESDEFAYVVITPA